MTFSAFSSAYWDERAAVVSAILEETKTPEVRQVLIRVVDGYRQLSIQAKAHEIAETK